MALKIPHFSSDAVLLRGDPAKNMPPSKPASGPAAKAAPKPKGTNGSGEDGSALDDRRGGILQILNGEDSEATMVDCYGLYWNAKAGPKKMNGKAAPVFTSRTQPMICVRAIPVCFTRVHALVFPITAIYWVVLLCASTPPLFPLSNLDLNGRESRVN